jgi:hypothetical protein
MPPAPFTARLARAERQVDSKAQLPAAPTVRASTQRREPQRVRDDYSSVLQLRDAGDQPNNDCRYDKVIDPYKAHCRHNRVSGRSAGWSRA